MTLFLVGSYTINVDHIPLGHGDGVSAFVLEGTARSKDGTKKIVRIRPVPVDISQQQPQAAAVHRPPNSFRPGVNPSSLCTSLLPDQKKEGTDQTVERSFLLYACNECTGDPSNSDTITAYELKYSIQDKHQHSIEIAPPSSESACIPSQGLAPCFLGSDPTGSFLVGVNYGQAARPGTVFVLGRGANSGQLEMVDGPRCPIADRQTKYLRGNTALQESIQLDDKNNFLGPHADRQECAHCHCSVFYKDSNYVFVTDLGCDVIYQYQLHRNTGQLELVDTIPLPEGTGPRHIAFHPDGSTMYVAGELSNTVVVFSVQQSGDIICLGHEPVQIMDALPGVEWKHNEDIMAQIMVHPNGGFLYTSVRGQDCICCFEVETTYEEKNSGNNEDAPSALEMNQSSDWKCVNGGPKLLKCLLERVSTNGRCPRHFTIHHDPKGHGDFLFVANQDSDNIYIFEINSDSGRLERLEVGMVSSCMNEDSEVIEDCLQCKTPTWVEFVGC